MWFQIEMLNNDWLKILTSCLVLMFLSHVSSIKCKKCIQDWRFTLNVNNVLEIEALVYKVMHNNWKVVACRNIVYYDSRFCSRGNIWIYRLHFALRHIWIIPKPFFVSSLYHRYASLNLFQVLNPIGDISDVGLLKQM